jgi:hypothetical protein
MIEIKEIIYLTVNIGKKDFPAFHAGSTGSNPVGDAMNKNRDLD